jgi:hypothetical protein
VAKKQTAKKAPETTPKASQEEQIVLGPVQEKALKLVEKSARVRGDLEEAVSLAIIKAVRKCMKDNKIALTPDEADDLAAIWFGDGGERPRSPSCADGELMHGFYKCLRGDNQHLAVFELDAFVVEDANGRKWICCPIPEEQVENVPLLAHVTDVHQADAKLRERGLSAGGTEVRIVYCETQVELQANLG